LDIIGIIAIYIYCRKRKKANKVTIILLADYMHGSSASL
jgi:hypothetical protein